MRIWGGLPTTWSAAPPSGPGRQRAARAPPAAPRSPRPFRRARGPQAAPATRGRGAPALEQLALLLVSTGELTAADLWRLPAKAPPG
jgi:hypothetical protein